VLRNERTISSRCFSHHLLSILRHRGFDFIVPLLIPEHAHHQLAVAIATVLAAGSVLGVLFF
jgi:hypothetical protein